MVALHCAACGGNRNLIKIGEEKRERTALVTAMQTTRVALGREKYIEMVKQTLKTAKSEVLFLSHSLTTSMSKADKKDLFGAYAHKKGELHRCITLPAAPRQRRRPCSQRRLVAPRLRRRLLERRPALASPPGW